MRNPMTRCVALFAALSLAACTTLQPVAGGPAAWRSSVEPGDTVKIATTDGRTLEFEVREVTDAGLRGADQAVSFTAISSLQKKDLSVWRTVGLVVGILAAGALAGGSDSYGSGGGSGGGTGGGGGGIYKR